MQCRFARCVRRRCNISSTYRAIAAVDKLPLVELCHIWRVELAECVERHRSRDAQLHTAQRLNRKAEFSQMRFDERITIAERQPRAQDSVNDLEAFVGTDATAEDLAGGHEAVMARFHCEHRGGIDARGSGRSEQGGARRSQHRKALQKPAPLAREIRT